MSFKSEGITLSVLHQIAYYQNRRDEIPNQELTAELVREQKKIYKALNQLGEG